MDADTFGLVNELNAHCGFSVTVSKRMGWGRAGVGMPTGKGRVRVKVYKTAL